MKNLGSNKIILAVVIVITFFLVILALSQNGGTTPQKKAKPADLRPQAVIILNSKGFKPQTITIKAGQRVMWKNQSGQAAAVNSNPHPANNTYPPLNLGQFANESTLQLIFPKAGKY